MAGEVTVSAIIPTFNRAGVVRRAIESVLRQDCEHFEVIVVDDGSRDGTETTLRDLVDPRLTFLRNESNRGGSAARNTGVRQSRGRYLAFLDSDDLWMPEKLTAQVRALAVSGCVWAYTGERVVDAASGAVLDEKRPHLEGPVFDALLREDFIGSCSSVMIARTAFDAAGGFDEGLPARQDWDLWLRVADVSPIACLPGCLVDRRVGHEQISSSLRAIIEGTRGVLGKHARALSERPSILRRHLSLLAQLELNYSRAQGWSTARQALRIEPLQPRLWAVLLLSLLPSRGYRTIWRWWKQRHGDKYYSRARL